MKGSEPGMKASEFNEKAPAGSKSAQDGNRMQGEKSKSMHSETDFEGRQGHEGRGPRQQERHHHDRNPRRQDRAPSRARLPARPRRRPRGNAATSATAAPPAEKRTQINTAIRSEKIQETTNVNFNISVGAAVPASVHFHPLPPRIVEIYPEWRGYEVILVHGRYVIVRPQTREIVYIIEG